MSLDRALTEYISCKKLLEALPIERQKLERLKNQSLKDLSDNTNLDWSDAQRIHEFFDKMIEIDRKIEEAHKKQASARDFLLIHLRAFGGKPVKYMYPGHGQPEFYFIYLENDDIVVTG